MILRRIFPTRDATVRLIAARLYPLKAKDRRREIAIEAGRRAEALRAAGCHRWEAVKLEDELSSAIRDRLAELDQIEAGEPAPIHLIAAGGTRA